jgi:hypothetical protein
VIPEIGNIFKTVMDYVPHTPLAPDHLYAYKQLRTLVLDGTDFSFEIDESNIWLVRQGYLAIQQMLEVMLCEQAQPLTIEKLIAIEGYIEDLLVLNVEEYQLLRDVQRLIFIGGGPLPVSPILYLLFRRLDRNGHLNRILPLISEESSTFNLAKAKNVLLACLLECPVDDSLSIVVVDNDVTQLPAAENNISQLGLSRWISVSASVPELLNATIVLASGVEPKTETVMELIRNSSGSLYMLVRSPNRARSSSFVIYPLLDDRAIMAAEPAAEIVEAITPSTLSIGINSVFSITVVSD